ncbi:Histidine kinase [Chitinophaga jiangningensis]|uniref:Histidine kinase n=1 Tax=Chitinophaga jiangningensis TaxID=1419482 RepID=A0A1M7EG93_9BACT|nr:histidine kinase [Chitinophaga jiangningensis]SHL90650.1 Histidine kinase [Chitinophaga jiangningensis]
MSAERNILLLLSTTAAMAVFAVLYFRNRQQLKLTRVDLEAALSRSNFLTTELSLLRRQLADMKLTSLKSQINPHFVFNCLNGIHSAVITGETARAKEYISGFARLLRMVLMLSGRNLISLREEMEILEHYLKLERLRTNEAFDYTLFTDPAISPADTLVPGMLIQPFLENAIWHGLMAKEEGNRHVAVRWKQLGDNLLHCVVEDNGIGRNLAALRCNVDLKAGTPHQSKGMEICLERIELYRNTFHSKCNIEIEDLADASNTPEGTRVSITFEVSAAMQEALTA